MSKKPEPQAEGLNIAEIQARFLERAEGGIPVRKRGYHRALKRGASWARMRDMVHTQLRDLYSGYIFETNRFIGLQSMLDAKHSMPIPLPIQYGRPRDDDEK